MTLTSPAFKGNEQIPSKYTCDGADISPPLFIADVPAQAKSLGLIVDDPDAPSGRFIHWTAWNIPPDTSEMGEDDLPEGAVEGGTGFGEPGYGGPCPPDREHRYFFKLCAMDSLINLSAGATVDMLENAIEHHVLAEAELMGRYEKK